MAAESPLGRLRWRRLPWPLDVLCSGCQGWNVGLKNHDLSDYHVSILEVAGSAATAEEVQAMESL